MKVSKENDKHRVSIYSPSGEEKEILYKISDEIIDLIDSYNLTDDQEIHLISSLYVSMKEVKGIIGMKHNPNDANEVEDE